MMQIQSPIAGLCEVLTTIEATAKQHAALFSKNEAATRAALIDPVLRALGWDTGNVGMVVVEQTYKSLRADYVLLDRNGQTAAIVEAKAYGASLTEVSQQIVSYAMAFSVTSVFVTNGLQWQHFRTHQLNTGQPLEPDYEFHITQDDPTISAKYLISHLDAAPFWQTGQTIDTLAQDVDELRDEVIGLKQQVQRLLTAQQGAIADPLFEPASPEPSASWVALSEAKNLTGRKPASLRLPNDEIIAVKYWKDILTQCCEFVMARSSDLPLPLPDASGKRINLFSLIPFPAKISQLATQYQGRSIYIYRNYDADACVRNSIHILSYLPENQNAWVIYGEE